MPRATRRWLKNLLTSLRSFLLWNRPSITTSEYALQGRRSEVFRYSSQACMLHPTVPAPPMWPPRKSAASVISVLLISLLIITYKSTLLRMSDSFDNSVTCDRLKSIKHAIARQGSRTHRRSCYGTQRLDRRNLEISQWLKLAVVVEQALDLQDLSSLFSRMS